MAQINVYGIVAECIFEQMSECEMDFISIPLETEKAAENYVKEWLTTNNMEVI